MAVVCNDEMYVNDVDYGSDDAAVRAGFDVRVVVVAGAGAGVGAVVVVVVVVVA